MSRWALIALVVTVLWLALMVAVSYYGFQYKDPVRIEGWKPDPR